MSIKDSSRCLNVSDLVPVGSRKPAKSESRRVYRRMTEEEMLQFLDRVKGRLLEAAADADLMLERFPKSSKMCQVFWDLHRMYGPIYGIYQEAQRLHFQTVLNRIPDHSARRSCDVNGDVTLYDLYRGRRRGSCVDICRSWFA